MRPFLALPFLAACGSSASVPATTPEPAPDEAEPEAAAVEAPAAAEPEPEEEGEWVWQPNDFRSRINAGRSGPVVGYLQTPEILADAERRGSSLFIETPFERENDLPLRVSIWADRTEPFEAPDVQDPIRVASHHRVLLHIDDEAPIELSCDTIEVLEDDGSSMGMGCAHQVFAVGADDDRWILVPGDSGLATGYHPDDSEIWYRSAEACEAAKEAEARSRQGC